MQLLGAHKDMTTHSAELNWGTRELGNRLCMVWAHGTVFLEIVKATVPIFNFKKKKERKKRSITLLSEKFSDLLK